MNIRRVFGKKFMSLSHFDNTYPTVGVVLVSGSNGAGKTAMAVEAPAFAIWGKTLRDCDPWQGDDGEVGVELADGTVIRRIRSGGKTRLDFNGRDFESSSKAQEAVIATYGDFETWRRTATFSVSDAAYFSEATDSERKRLLENLLGLDRFDKAYATARDEANTLSATIAGTEARVTLLEEKVQGLQARLEELSTLAVASPPPPGLELERSKLSDEARETRAEYDTLLALSGDYARKMGEKSALLSQAARAKSGTCPTCGQAVTDKCVIDEATLRAEHTTLTGEKQRIQTSLVQVEARLKSIRDRQAELAQIAATSAQAAKQAAEVDAVRQKVQAELALDTSRLQDAYDSLAQNRKDFAVLQVVVQTLGTRGVRSLILGKALEGLNAAANVWMSRLAPGVTLTFSSQTERKSGAVADVISFNIYGLANGKGYKALSAGQRARVDLAVLLGLADLSGGVGADTLFMDEVFDRLDQEGVAAVVRVLGELALNRPVVVITHSMDLAERLPTIAKLRVGDGKIRLA